MDLRQLRYFVAVANERNVTRAAELLHIAQPPLSRQIQQLEDELGVPLLIRTSRPLKLTEAGRLFYEQALQILGRVEQVKNMTRRVGNGERSVLSIGFVASTLYSGLPTLVRRLRQHDPALDVQLIEMYSIQQTQALKSGRIDLGFGRLRVTDPGVERLVIHAERLMAAYSPEHPFADDTAPLPVGLLDGQRVIIYPKEPRPSYADQVLSLLHDHGVHPPEITEVRELQTALGLVAADAGICIVPSSARFIRPDVLYRPLADEFATSPIVLSHRRHDRSEYVEFVKALTLEMYREHPG
ncbi:LysR family transcriptional regulator [Burkholderia sp. TSV86]|uniref:LysR family transcriptional regulator n=1 Tax=Burkholderia sp. TSV86 TaxID=1385594 RepID=UPI00075DC8E6|nr:LysR family transcriptional regulator [Burkholderia sp. TSV86]KVE36429.1 LysR family transcriptional regulator [Burkholderia sp. TSV86]